MDLYSRQIGAYGLELMGRLSQLQILVCGLNGVGVETAKNLILAGPKQVVLYDPNPADIRDLQTNFYLTKEDIEGKVPKAQACVKKLSTLNPYVQVKAYNNDIVEAFLRQFHVVVITLNMTQESLTQINEICRSHGTKFIYGWTSGVVASVFSDFGKSHTVTDPDGEPTRMNVVQSISKTGVVKVAANRHRLDDGDHVRFEELEGSLSRMNSSIGTDNQPINVFAVKRLFGESRGADGKTRSVLLSDRFQIVDFPTMTEDYSGTGMASQVKMPISLNYCSFAESCINPITSDQFMLPHMDMNKLLTSNRSAQLHFARLALWRFQSRNNGELPKLHDLNHALECVNYAKEVLRQHQSLDKPCLLIDSIDEDVVFAMSLYARTELPGFTAFLGGAIAQECIKAAGKYMPLNQWLHHDALELLASPRAPAADASLVGFPASRYDHQIAIFGRSFQQKLFEQKWFLVGAGALGCEYIKSIALIGLGCNPKGLIHVTDMDRIEVSNLNRQFLFRRDNVGQAKSACATLAAQTMNEDLQCRTYEVAVGPDTEDVFDDDFWSSLDGVWNALDNVKARQYTDSMCVLFDKPLLESGTLGTKANCEVVIPFQTQSYSEQKEQEEDSIPMCTLRNFPHFTEHCIEWARAQFSDWFSDMPSEFNSLICDPDAFLKQVAREGNTSVQVQSLLKLISVLEEFNDGKIPTFQTAIRFACQRFVDQFRNRVSDLIHTFPQDYRKVDPETGTDLGPFWTGEKRFPRSTEIDLQSPLHVDFITAAANLYAFIFKIPQVRDRDAIVSMASNFESAPWTPEKVKIDEADSNTADDQQSDGSDESELAALLEKLKTFNLKKIPDMIAAEFEKDDDSNFHIDFITAASNLRSWNYRIKEASRHTCKVISRLLQCSLLMVAYPDDCR